MPEETEAEKIEKAKARAAKASKPYFAGETDEEREEDKRRIIAERRQAAVEGAPQAIRFKTRTRKEVEKELWKAEAERREKMKKTEEKAEKGGGEPEE